MQNYNLERFVKAQENTYEVALSEIRSGRKESHWMWFIFPQIKGLGRSQTAVYYAIENLEEASQYLNHPILGARLINISEELLKIEGKSAVEIFDKIDAAKLKSSMTLFSLIEGAPNVFDLVLQKYFKGNKDNSTISINNKN